MNKPQSYWEKRKARELYEELVKAEDTAEEMRQLHMAASREVQEEAVKLARRFQLRHNLTAVEARRLLTAMRSPDDITNLIQMLKQDPKNAELAAELESQAYASRINRLLAVQNSIDTVATQIYRRTNAATVAVLQDIGRSMYYKQIFEMQQRAGAAFGFTPLDPDRLMGIINRRWSGQNFSERLWANREQLAAEVKKQLLLGILTGRANRKMAQEIDGRFSVSYNNTRRLVRTEANYVANQLQVESYKDTGVDKYIYVAILDLRTSEICIELDKKRFLVSSAVVGENYPPMHPWCRSTTIAWMPDQLLKKLQQSAIDPATGEVITVPGDMTYQEWYDKYARGNSEPQGSARSIVPQSSDIEWVGGKNDPELTDNISDYYLPAATRARLPEIEELTTYDKLEKWFAGQGIKLDTDLAELKTDKRFEELPAVSAVGQKLATAVDAYKETFGPAALTKLKRVNLYDESLDEVAAYHYNQIGESDPLAGTIRIRDWNADGRSIFHEMAHAYQDSMAGPGQDAVSWAADMVKRAELPRSFSAYTGAAADVREAERFADAFGFGFARGSKTGLQFIKNVRSEQINTSGLSSRDIRDIIPEHDPPRLLETIDFSDRAKIQETLQKYEAQIVSSDIENAIVISETGDVYHCFGNVNGVWPDADLGEKLRRAYATHNHPRGSDHEYSFSKVDYNLFMDYELRELGGVDDRYVYRLSRLDTTTDPLPSIREAMVQEGYLQRHSEVIRDALADGVGYTRRRRK